VNKQRFLTEHWYFLFKATVENIPSYGMNKYPMYNMLTIRALHSSTHCFPFDTCFGYLPKVPLELIYGRDVDSNEEINEDSAHKFIQRIQRVHQVVREQLEKTQA
jgi:hypothetical protein